MWLGNQDEGPSLGPRASPKSGQVPNPTGPENRHVVTIPSLRAPQGLGRHVGTIPRALKCFLNYIVSFDPF